MSAEFDYIVVGGGTSGCVLASELQRLQAGSIVVIESGSQPVGRRIHTPALYTSLFESRWDHNLVTVPQSSLRGREIPWPRGKMLGGCSGMNAMIYSRGSRFDFLTWPKEWRYPNLLNYFERIEDLFFGENPSACGSSNSYSQNQGDIELHPLSERFLLAAQQSGLKILSDNGLESRPGACRFQRTQRAGRRQTTFSVFLSPSSVQWMSNATVQEIILDDQRATGVSVQIEKQLFEIKARKGVILAAGAIHSPTLLQRSGIGPVDVLEQSGVEVKVSNKRVGENLQDHLIFPLIYASHRLNAMASMCHPSEAERSARIRYAQDRTGPLTSNIAEVGGFSTLHDGKFELQKGPEIQWHFTPTHYLEYPNRPDPTNAWTIGVTLLHPKSRGKIRIAADNDHSVLIDPAYFSHPDDLDQTVRAISQATEIAEQPALAEYHRGQILPGSKRNTIDRMQASIRAYSTTIYHPIGTCAMGSPSDSVVNSGLQVHEVANLFVADASVIPEQPSANPQAVVMMIGCRMASILADS